MCLLLGIANSHHDPVHDPTLAREVHERREAREDSNIDRFRAFACDPPHLPVFSTYCMSNFNPTEVLCYFIVCSTACVRKLSVSAARQAREVFRPQAPG